ncbi:hypothetical protein BaRGS_00007174 [Batillaria attramentaria]|uniref:Uncharacterized protein n=1 Tax=Batillaria attramentaria TaxID=370345 RepID=A0ABD0LQL3_9CAEN
MWCSGVRTCEPCSNRKTCAKVDVPKSTRSETRKQRRRLQLKRCQTKNDDWYQACQNDDWYQACQNDDWYQACQNDDWYQACQNDDWYQACQNDDWYQACQNDDWY